MTPVTGNYGTTNRLYQWDAVADTFKAGTDITTDARFTRSVTLGDLDRDGDLDVVVGNSGQTNQLYINYYGDLGPESGGFATGWDITSDPSTTWSVALETSTAMAIWMWWQAMRVRKPIDCISGTR